MFGFGKKYKTPKEETGAPAEAAQKPGLFARLQERLSRTRHNLTDGLADLILGRKQIDDELLEELETLLLTADVGVEATSRIIRNLTERVKRKELADPDALSLALKQQLLEILQQNDTPLPQRETAKPLVLMMVGINGAGKTTTIG